MVKNSEEVLRGWKDMVLMKEDLLFNLYVEKMFTNIKTSDVEKEFKRLIGEEIIRGRRKEKILETLRYI